MSVPRSYVLPRVLVITDDLAPRIQALLAPGRERLKRDARTPPPDLVLWLAELDHLCSARTSSAPSPAPRWISTAAAADRLGISPRGVRDLGDRLRWQTRTVKGRREWLESDLLDEIEHRQSSEGVGVCESAGSPEW